LIDGLLTQPTHRKLEQILEQVDASIKHFYRTHPSLRGVM